MRLPTRFSERKHASAPYEAGIDTTALRLASTTSSSPFVSNAGKRSSLLATSDTCLSLGSPRKKSSQTSPAMSHRASESVSSDAHVGVAVATSFPNAAFPLKSKCVKRVKEAMADHGIDLNALSRKTMRATLLNSLIRGETVSRRFAP